MGKRRRFGKIRKLPSGRYQASYLDSRTGKRVVALQTYKTKTAAEHWLIDIESSLHRGDLPDLEAGRLPFTYWADHWLDTRQVRRKTINGYRGIVTNHLNPVFGNLPINSIDRSKVMLFVADMTKRNIPEGTRTNIRRTLSMILNEALRSRAITFNPTDGVRIKRSRREEMVFLTRQQVAILAHSIGNPTFSTGGHVSQTYSKHYPQYEVMVRFVSETGLRSGEIAALRIGDLDLVNRRVYVSRSASETEGQLIYESTKTYETRSVPIPKMVAQEMQEHLKSRPNKASAFVFTSVEGTPLRHKYFYNRHYVRAVKQSVDQEGKPLVPPQTRFHDLRHTYAALLIAAGANALTVKQRMGHSSITVTMDRYGHLFPHLEEELTDRMDEAYREAQESLGAREGHAHDSANESKDAPIPANNP